MTDAPKQYGQTRADIEATRDREAIAALDRAERESGIRTGVRFREDRSAVLVTVSFHPRTRFHQHDLDLANSRILSEARPFDLEEFQSTESLKL